MVCIYPVKVLADTLGHYSQVVVSLPPWVAAGPAVQGYVKNNSNGEKKNKKKNPIC